MNKRIIIWSLVALGIAALVILLMTTGGPSRFDFMGGERGWEFG